MHAIYVSRVVKSICSENVQKATCPLFEMVTGVKCFIPVNCVY